MSDDEIELLPSVGEKREDSVDERQSECSEYSFCVRGQCLEGPPPLRWRWSLLQYLAQLVCLQLAICVYLVVLELRIEDQEILVCNYSSIHS